MTNLRQLNPEDATRLLTILKDLIWVPRPAIYPRILEVSAAVQPGLTEPITVFNRPREKDGKLQPIQLIQIADDMFLPWYQVIADMLTEKLLYRANEIGIDTSAYANREALFIAALNAKKSAQDFLFDIYDEWFPNGYEAAKAEMEAKAGDELVEKKDSTPKKVVKKPKS